MEWKMIVFKMIPLPLQDCLQERSVAQMKAVNLYILNNEAIWF